MVPGLLDALGARFVFVVGKGGVGKSTASGAIALGLADAADVHLITTDPAPSLADLFEQELAPGVVTPARCAPRLTLEELDASAGAAAWIGEAREPIAELIDRGTYLDRKDVGELLDRSLPGVDEVMAALRLAELEGSERGRVIVDTAPTGHTLRLLDAGLVLEGWVRALAALADKANVVASALAGRQIRFAGERVMEGLRDRVSTFTRRVLPAADFVIVTREHEVVEAETRRLVVELRERGLRVAAVVGVGGGAEGLEAGGAPSFTVPWTDEARGCEGLGRWGLPAAARPAAERGPPRLVDADSTLDQLGTRRLLLFAGKGGVGKSTCAAALASRLAAGRRVQLLSVDPAGSLADVFGRDVPADGGEMAPGLTARQVDAEREFERFRRRYRDGVAEVFERLGLERSAPLDRRVLESIIDLAPPGLDEIFALEALIGATAGDDLIVLDTAPTGHFIRFLEMPETALSWTRAVLRILLRYRSVLGLDDFAGDLLQFARQLGTLVGLLADADRTGVMVVTGAETLPRLESERLVSKLDRDGVPVAALIQNRWTPLDRASSSPAATAPEPGRSPNAPEPGGPGPTAQRGPLRLLAPLREPPPVGTAALRAFAASWKLQT